MRSVASTGGVIGTTLSGVASVRFSSIGSRFTSAATSSEVLPRGSLADRVVRGADGPTHHPPGGIGPGGVLRYGRGSPTGTLLVRRDASVDEQQLAGDERGGRRGEEDDRGGDVLGRAEAPQGRAGDLVVAVARQRAHALACQVRLHE